VVQLPVDFSTLVRGLDEAHLVSYGLQLSLFRAQLTHSLVVLVGRFLHLGDLLLNVCYLPVDRRAGLEPVRRHQTQHHQQPDEHQLIEAGNAKALG
jgi:hypothetical protein